MSRERQGKAMALTAACILPLPSTDTPLTKERQEMNRIKNRSDPNTRVHKDITKMDSKAICKM